MAKSKYDSHVRPRFYDIEQWLKNGLDEKQVIANLGIGKTSWESYKHKHPELTDLIKRAIVKPVQEVKDSLYKMATGFYYHVDEPVKVKNADGSETVQTVRLCKFKAPETAAICFYLKNKAKDEFADNPQMIDLKKEELEIRRQEANFKQW
jgi:hypothetical protein